MSVLFATFKELQEICTWPTPNHGSTYSSEEINFLKEHVQKLPAKELAKAAGRQLDGICIKLEKEGVLFKNIVNGCYYVKQPSKITETMQENKPIVEHKTFIDGYELATMTEDQLIDKLSKLHVRIEKYKNILTDGKYLEAKLKEMLEAKDLVKNELNKRVQ